MSTLSYPILTAGDLAYLGGLFDGEGSGGVYPRHKKRKRDSWSRANMVVTMTDPEPVYFFLLCFGGGNIYKRTLKSGKIAYQWSVSDKSASRVAHQLLPYVKTEHRTRQLQAVADYIPKTGHRGGGPRQ